MEPETVERSPCTSIPGPICEALPALKLKHVERFKDRHGQIRYYFRRGHGKRTPLPGPPGCDGFLEAYTAALAETEPRAAPTERHKPGTVGALVQAYLETGAFKKHRASTKEVTRRILERFAADHGHRLVSQLTHERVQQIMGRLEATPAAANNFLKRLRVLMKYAVVLKLRADDPTQGVKKYAEGEHHTWTERELSKFEARHPLGTVQRTGFALALYTGQRRADLCRLEWSDIDGGVLRLTQEKTETELEIPVHPKLKEALDAWLRRGDVILTSATGSGYRAESFGNLMADAIEAAGLPKRCVLHGLRKAAARRLAEAGCSEKEIASVTGHKTLSEVARYTKAASQGKLAQAALNRVWDK